MFYNISDFINYKSIYDEDNKQVASLNKLLITIRAIFNRNQCQQPQQPAKGNNINSIRNLREFGTHIGHFSLPPELFA